MTSPPSVTWLFVPGDRPDRFDTAAAAGADEVVIDLEDTVAWDDKATARDAVARWLTAGNRAWVRVNGVGTPWHEDDLAAMAGAAGLAGVMLPKAERADDAARVATTAGAGVVALVESAAGVLGAVELARTPAVVRLAFGSIDYALDVDCEESHEALLLARSSLVATSRAAGLPGPVDGVSVQVSDATAVATDAARARGLGFAGKLCIHPAQVPVIRRAFAPTDEDVAWATSVLEALPAGATAATFSLDGRMVDRPVVERARAIRARADAAHRHH